MSNLPSEIWYKVQKSLPLSDQPHFRRVARETAAAPTNWQKQCCEEPTKYELADWILQKRQEIAPNYTNNPGEQIDYKNNPFEDSSLPYLHFEDVTNPGNVLTIMVMKTGQLFHNRIIYYDDGSFNEFFKLITSRNQLVNVLHNRRILFLRPQSLEFEWSIIRDILLQRRGCIDNVFSVQKCMFKVFEKQKNMLYSSPGPYFSLQEQWRSILISLVQILNEKGKLKLIQAIDKHHPILPIVSDDVQFLSGFFNRVPGFPKLPDASRQVWTEHDDVVFQQDPENYDIQLNDQLKYLYDQLDPSDLF